MGVTHAADLDFLFGTTGRDDRDSTEGFLADVLEFLPAEAVNRTKTLLAGSEPPGMADFQLLRYPDLVRALEPGETVREWLGLDIELLVLTDRRVIHVRPRLFGRKTRLSAIAYRVLRAVDLQKELFVAVDLSRKPRRRDHKPTKIFPETKLVITSNLDEPAIELTFLGKNGRDRADRIEAAIQTHRREDYARRAGKEVRTTD